MTATRSNEVELPDLHELQALVSVVDAGSVSGGARDLGQPRATISRRLARLEERVGMRLLHRTTRRLALTAAGEELFEHARGIIAAVDAATEALHVQDPKPRGLLRVSVPPMHGGTVREMLLAFVGSWPDVDLELISTTVHEDLLVRHIDVAFRASATFAPGLIARKLVDGEMRVVASPGYLEKAGVPATPDALTSHRCLVGFARGERAVTHWPLLGGGQARIAAHIASNDLPLLLRAALAGEGLALLPDVFITESLASGALVPVLADRVGVHSQVALVFQERQLMRPVVRAFVDHAVKWSNDIGLFEPFPT